MARTTPRSAARARGRQVQRRSRTGWTIPLAFGLILVVGLGVWLWQRGAPGTAGGSSRPISTVPSQDVHALVWSPADANTVFFGHHGGLLKSTDGGRTWQPTTLANADAMALGASPKAPQRIYAAGHNVFQRSDDGGASWTAPPSSVQGVDIHGFAQSPAEPDRLYAMVVGQGLLTSTDGGANWTPVTTAPQGQAIAVSGDGKTLLMSTQAGVQQSGDSGATWTAAGAGLPRRAQVISLATDPNGDAVFAATTEGVYRRAGTGNWEATGLKGTILTVAVSPAQPGAVLAVDEQGKVYRSDDGGMTWGGRAR